ncbi:probable E3 ubiquitin-protein ligase ZFP1 [Elaeis guineensis]|uniref:RING-type E3 ubiquitin transferase n=1 Tax=Elaeis guineensis var. tenera TaxID=51953 RepID=A0A6I9Q8W9_ELAGV|nr:probable E3 ubiquitin-protein ligase ZFP1 [Elaeis guineensis]
MGHVLQNHQVRDMRSEQGLNYLHPNDCIFLGSSLNSTNQSIPPVLPASGNSADLHLQFTDPSRRNCIADPYRRNCIHGNHYNGMQYCQPVSGNYVGEVAPANFYNPCLPPPSSRLLSIPINKRFVDHVLSSTNQRAFGTVMNDGRDNYSIDGLNEPRKRKNTEVVAENFDYYNAVGNSNFSSAYLFLNSELSQWLEPYNYGGSSVTAFTVPGYQANGILTTTEDSHRLVKDRSSAISPQPVHPFSCHHNYLLQGNQMDQTFQPSGACLNSGHLEVADTSVHEYQGNPPNRYAACYMHNPSFPNAYQNYSPVQIMQVQSYSYHTQMPAPSYWHPFNNLHADNVYALRNDQESCSRFVGPMPSLSEQMYVPPIFGTVPGFSYELRNPPFEDAMEIPQFYSFEDSFDQYSDMRMDIDDMSYEELLDLEEKIGDVKTGLSEEFVLKNLRTSMHVQQSTSLALGSLSQAAFENGTCMVCQVEYEDSERIGTLGCGHSYHADCIKQWLFVKNTCPICKAPALVANKKDG